LTSSRDGEPAALSAPAGRAPEWGEATSSRDDEAAALSAPAGRAPEWGESTSSRDGEAAARSAPAGRPPGWREATRSRIGGVAHDYVLVVPGGGTGHPRASDAVEQFHSAALGLAATGVETIFVGRAEVRTADPASRLRVLGSLPQTELAELMRGARLIIANGGSTLLQSIACGKPCIAVPIAGDQSERIRRCVRAGVAVGSTLDAASIVRTATGLLQNGPQLEALAGRAIALGLADGVEVALRALNALMAEK
jgi:UDP-N-acetylglucosamine:LPS N-acetylglucosamine transferase